MPGNNIITFDPKSPEKINKMVEEVNTKISKIAKDIQKKRSMIY
jgi:hypothetical protein